MENDMSLEEYLEEAGKIKMSFELLKDYVDRKFYGEAKDEIYRNFEGNVRLFRNALNYKPRKKYGK